MITDQERMKTDVVFVDTVIRECAQLSIQHESDKLKIEALERQIAEGVKASDLQAAADALVGAESAMQQRLTKAKYQIEWLMKVEILAVCAQISLARWARYASRCGKRVLTCDAERTFPALLPQSRD